MKFPYLVVHNGVEYPIGTDVPIEVNKPVVKEVAEVVETPALTKTDINRTPIDKLKILAKEHGIDDKLSGAEIKKALIEKLGL